MSSKNNNQNNPNRSLNSHIRILDFCRLCRWYCCCIVMCVVHSIAKTNENRRNDFPISASEYLEFLCKRCGICCGIRLSYVVMIAIVVSKGKPVNAERTSQSILCDKSTNREYWIRFGRSWWLRDFSMARRALFCFSLNSSRNSYAYARVPRARKTLRTRFFPNLRTQTNKFHFCIRICM